MQLHKWERRELFNPNKGDFVSEITSLTFPDEVVIYFARQENNPFDLRGICKWVR
jgi:hypothetical protein